MNAQMLAGEILDKLEASDLPFVRDGHSEAFAACIAEAVVAHIATNAQVSTTVPLGIPVQVAPASGTGATTGPGTGTGRVS